MKNAVLVTGASSGIGAAIARRMAIEATVILTGRNSERLLALRSELTGSLAFPCDLRKDSEALANYVTEQTSKNSLRLAGIVNNAGIYTRKNFLETTDNDWREIFEVDLFAPVALTRRLYPLLKKSAPASVLNISSTLALRTVVNTSAYSAAKAAMVSWTNTLALEWAPDNIRVNCICPGLVDTPIHPFHRRPESDPERLQAHARQPLKRMGTPEDIAEAAAFLLSGNSSWTTGTVLTVDGGIHL